MRHEAIHLAQDCMRRKHDGKLDSLTQSFHDLMSLAHDSGIDARGVEALYRNRGANDQIVVLEIEAFSMAGVFSTTQIEDIVVRACFR